MYSTKDKIINNNMVIESCSWYNDIETWGYVVTYAITYQFIPESIVSLNQKFIKVDIDNKHELI